jgi:hypothetical protein
MNISEYDQWTIHYLRGVGVSGALLERVERLAEEVASLTAELESAKADPKAGV